MIHHYIKSITQESARKAIFLSSCEAKFDCLSKVGDTNFEAKFTSPLTTTEKAELDLIFQNTPIFDIDFTNKKIQEKIEVFGKSMMYEYGRKNMARGYTEAQVRQVSSDLAEVTRLISQCALPTVLLVLSTFTPTTEILVEDIQEFSDKITNFLGTL